MLVGLFRGALDAGRAGVVMDAASADPVGPDIDGDGIVDVVEEAICGSATCATGVEDADADGIPDAVTLTESLRAGGPGGPVQFPSFGEVLVVWPDGQLVQFAWWPVALAVVSLTLAVVGVVVVARRRVR